MQLRHIKKNLTFICTLACTCVVSLFADEETPQMQWSDSVVQTDELGKSVLIIPMEGQMHTDIRPSVYKNLAERIKDVNPDLIIVEIESQDRQNNFAYLMGYGDRNEFNLFDADDLIEIAKVFYIELGDIPQVAWVKDSSGVSTVLALSWPTMYMSDGGFLRSTAQVADFMAINNEDTHGKIREFRVINSKIVAEYGDRSYALVRAFIDPDVPLSGTWKGKKVEWEESTLGDFVIDPGEDSQPTFTSIQATELGICEGIVSSREDVLLAQGIREYHLVGEDITSEIEMSVDDWREELADAKELWGDAQQFSQWAGSGGGDEAIRNRRSELATLRQILKIMKKNPPVAKRLGRPYQPGISIRYLEQRIEELVDLLDRMKNGGSRGSGGGSGGRGGMGGR